MVRTLGDYDWCFLELWAILKLLHDFDTYFAFGSFLVAFGVGPRMTANPNIGSHFLIAQLSLFFTYWDYFWLFSLRYEKLRDILLQRINIEWTLACFDFLKRLENGSVFNYAKVCRQCCVSHYRFSDLSEWVLDYILKLWHNAFCYQMYKKKPGNSFFSFSEILIT